MSYYTKALVVCHLSKDLRAGVAYEVQKYSGLGLLLFGPTMMTKAAKQPTRPLTVDNILRNTLG